MPRGRPKEENPRDLLLRVRITPAEYQWLAGLSRKHGRSMSDIVRFMVFAGMPSATTVTDQAAQSQAESR